MFWGYFRHSQNRGISGISKPSQYFDSHSKKKNGSTFVKVSIESSEIRAFDRALNEGASCFSSRVIPILVLRICYFFGPRISKTSKLATLRRPLSVQKVVCPPPKSRLKNAFSRGSRNFWAAKSAATRVHFLSHRFDIWDDAGVSLRVQPGNLKMWFCATIWADLITPENCPYYFESVWFDIFWSDFWGGDIPFSFLKSLILEHLS